MKLVPWIGVLLALGSASARADGPLRSVIVFGNEQTERQTILDMIGVPSHTYVDQRLVRDVDDRLVNSGLFREVRVRKVDNRDGTCDLRIYVAEKQLWFVFPVFQAWSGRYSGGGVFGETNLFVPRGRTLILLQGGNKSSRMLAAFDKKSLFGSNFLARTWVTVATDDVPLYEGETKTDEINMKDVAVGLASGYEWTRDIQTSLEVKYRYVSYGQSPAVVESGTSGHDVSLKFWFTYDSLRRREALLKGTKFEALYEFADSRFGTDFTYHIEKVEWQQAFYLGRGWNYMYFVEGAIADGLPFHREFTLGGSSLRGYADREFRGDTTIVARQDLLVRLWRHRKFSLFGGVFYDLGFLYRDADGAGASDLHNGVGGGLRVSLADIVAPVFGLDVGYGIEDNAYHIYLALGLVDF
jgi:outer membrane protein insertion porin family